MYYSVLHTGSLPLPGRSCKSCGFLFNIILKPIQFSSYTVISFILVHFFFSRLAIYFIRLNLIMVSSLSNDSKENIWICQIMAIACHKQKEMPSGTISRQWVANYLHRLFLLFNVTGAKTLSIATAPRKVFPKLCQKRAKNLSLQPWSKRRKVCASWSRKLRECAERRKAITQSSVI